jgi:AcrR family transcriptional regulator
MAKSRRVGAETSEKRGELLDCVESLMLTKGYAAVTYRAVAARAGVTAGLVQYYFPTLDDLFLATIRRGTEHSRRRLEAALHARPDEPLRVLWEYSRREAGAALTTELLALGNHRKSIASEIALASEHLRQLQIEAIADHASDARLDIDGLSPGALAYLVAGLPRLLHLEESVGLTATHDAVVAFVESLLDRAEPRITSGAEISQTDMK